MESRFPLVIIDEAQDLSNFREEFAKLIAKSKINVIVFGDVNQNINGGGEWFDKLTATDTKEESYRCPDDNCKWIRNNLDIKIFGNLNNGGINKIKISDVKSYDDSKRFLLYSQNPGKKSLEIEEIIDNWSGPKSTIKKAKGETIESDIVVVGKTLSVKNSYVALTRTTKTAYITFNLTKLKKEIIK